MAHKIDHRSGRPWRRLRDRIVRRDGGICHLCGQPGADTADHIVPVSLGGAERDPRNLRAAHQQCNKVRGNRPIEQARAAIAQRHARANSDDESDAWSW